MKRRIVRLFQECLFNLPIKFLFALGDSCGWNMRFLKRSVARPETHNHHAQAWWGCVGLVSARISSGLA